MYDIHVSTANCLHIKHQASLFWDQTIREFYNKNICIYFFKLRIKLWPSRYVRLMSGGNATKQICLVAAVTRNKILVKKNGSSTNRRISTEIKKNTIWTSAMKRYFGYLLWSLCKAILALTNLRDSWRRQSRVEWLENRRLGSLVGSLRIIFLWLFHWLGGNNSRFVVTLTGLTRTRTGSWARRNGTGFSTHQGCPPQSKTIHLYLANIFHLSVSVKASARFGL